MEHQQQNQADKQHERHLTGGRTGSTAVATPVMHPLLRLQQTVGNQAAQRLVQARLEISVPEDLQERQADQLAEQIATATPARKRRPACAAGKLCTKCKQEQERLIQAQRKAESVPYRANAVLPAAMLQSLGTGSPLPPGDVRLLRGPFRLRLRTRPATYRHDSLQSCSLHSGPGIHGRERHRLLRSAVPARYDKRQDPHRPRTGACYSTGWAG